MTLADLVESAMRWPAVLGCVAVAVLAVLGVARRHRPETLASRAGALGRAHRARRGR